MIRNIYLKLIFSSMLLGIFTQVQGQTLADEMLAIADIVVDTSGSGDYTTVQEALSAVPDSNDTWMVIFVRKGSYYEKIRLLHKKTKVVLVGEDVDSTVLWYDDHANAVLPGHTFSSYSFRADANDFQAYNLTFKNPETSSQAVAFHSNGDRQILYHCKMLSYQDTYFDNFRTRRYIKDCYIEGAVDYIFGFGVTLFDSCQIHTFDDGYITAAATPQYYEFGYVFKNCYLTKPEGRNPAISLGRPWFPYSNVTYFECYEEKIINRGWSSWDGREATAIYYEYNCFGPGYKPERRSYGTVLDSSLAWRYNLDTIFAASNFPSDSGYVVDSLELWSMRDRFEASGYADRADTILYAGRDSYPSYPTDNWHPVYYDSVYNIIRKYTQPFVASIATSVKEAQLEGIHLMNPVGNKLVIFSSQNTPGAAKLSLFDMNGRRVLEHKMAQLPKGSHAIDIESLGLKTGLYFYNLNTPAGSLVGKILKN